MQQSDNLKNNQIIAREHQQIVAVALNCKTMTKHSKISIERFKYFKIQRLLQKKLEALL